VHQFSLGPQFKFFSFFSDIEVDTNRDHDSSVYSFINK